MARSGEPLPRLLAAVSDAGWGELRFDIALWPTAEATSFVRRPGTTPYRFWADRAGDVALSRSLFWIALIGENFQPRLLSGPRHRLLVRRLDSDVKVPAKSTIHAVLDRHDLVKRGGGRVARRCRRARFPRSTSAADAAPVRLASWPAFAVTVPEFHAV